MLLTKNTKNLEVNICLCFNSLKIDLIVKNRIFFYSYPLIRLLDLFACRHGKYFLIRKIFLASIY